MGTRLDIEGVVRDVDAGGIGRCPTHVCARVANHLALVALRGSR